MNGSRPSLKNLVKFHPLVLSWTVTVEGAEGGLKFIDQFEQVRIIFAYVNFFLNLLADLAMLTLSMLPMPRRLLLKHKAN